MPESRTLHWGRTLLHRNLSCLNVIKKKSAGMARQLREKHNRLLPYHDERYQPGVYLPDSKEKRYFMGLLKNELSPVWQDIV